MLFWHLGMTAAIVFLTLGKRRIDYRVVLLGSILSDLIDKPIGRIFFEDTFQTSRLFAHTLLFVVILVLGMQLFLRGERARRWYVLAVAVLLHLVLDGLWSDPITLFWPAFGTEFPPHAVDSYWLDVFLRPLRHPVEGLKELVGLGILFYMAYAYKLFDKNVRRDFVRTGKLI